MLRFLDSVLDNLKPDPIVKIVASQFISDLQHELDKHNLPCEVVLGGSVAKDTHLRGSSDVDVFVRFPLTYPFDFSDSLEQVLKPFKPMRVGGSRDYFQLEYRNCQFEVVPTLAASTPSQAQNTTDLSIFHVSFLKKSGVDTNQIRLLKQFCKANGVYGSESFIRGLSGHVLDLLVVEYGSFWDTIFAVSQWKLPLALNPANHSSPLDSFPDPLVIYDPIIPSRNAAAALDGDMAEKFILQAQAFVASPSEDFFVVEEFSLDDVDADIVFEVSVDEVLSRDVFGSRVRRFAEQLEREVSVYGFKASANWHVGEKSFVWISSKGATLSADVEVSGPPVSEVSHVEKFKAKHSDAYVRSGRWYAVVRREFTEFDSCVQAVFSSVASRCGVSVVIV